MAIAGHLATVSISTVASSGFVEWDGIKSFSIGDSSEMLDITDFADERLRRRIVGLRDLTASLDGDVEAGNTAYTLARTLYSSGSPLWLRVLHDGTNGIVAQFVLGSFERSASVDGLVELSVSMEHSGDVAPISVGTGF
jgi:predicted secreted protein